MQGGPFARARHSEELDNLVNEAARLSPLGIPERHNVWRGTNLSVGNMECVNFAKEVFARTTQAPISNILVSKEMRPQTSKAKCSGDITKTPN